MLLLSRKLTYNTCRLFYTKFSSICEWLFFFKRIQTICTYIWAEESSKYCSLQLLIAITKVFYSYSKITVDDPLRNSLCAFTRLDGDTSNIKFLVVSVFILGMNQYRAFWCGIRAVEGTSRIIFEVWKSFSEQTK